MRYQLLHQNLQGSFSFIINILNVINYNTSKRWPCYVDWQFRSLNKPQDSSTYLFSLLFCLSKSVYKTLCQYVIDKGALDPCLTFFVVYIEIVLEFTVVIMWYSWGIIAISRFSHTEGNSISNYRLMNSYVIRAVILKTLDILRYHITRCHTQCAKFKGETLVRQGSH